MSEPQNSRELAERIFDLVAREKPEFVIALIEAYVRVREATVRLEQHNFDSTLTRAVHRCSECVRFESELATARKQLKETL